MCQKINFYERYKICTQIHTERIKKTDTAVVASMQINCTDVYAWILKTLSKIGKK